MPLIARLLLALTTLLFAAPAMAANCTVTASTNANLGSQTSYTVLAGTVPTVSGSAGLSCSGALLSLLSTDYARATASSVNGFALRNASGDAIAYRLSADQNGTFSYTQGGTVDYLNPQLLSLLGLGGTDLTAPLYARLTASPNLPAGTYTDTVTITWQWSVCRGIGALGACVLRETGTGTTLVTVTMTITKDCRLTAPAISFGSAPLVAKFAAVTQAVQIACTKGAMYSVSFTAGGAGSARPWRAMTDGAGHMLRYNIYRPDGTTVWDESNPLSVATPGTGATSPDQPQTYVAKVDTSQATPPAGSYIDTLSVLVSF
jgi:spore coat protein U-like protein